MSVNNDGAVMWVLSCDMEKSHGQLEMVISPLSFGLALMFPTQSAFRGRDSLLSVLTLIHAAQFSSHTLSTFTCRGNTNHSCAHQLKSSFPSCVLSKYQLLLSCFISVSAECSQTAVWGRGSCHQLLYYQSTRWSREAHTMHSLTHTDSLLIRKIRSHRLSL